MFESLDTQELLSLLMKLIGANRAVVDAHGVSSDLNAEMLAIFDEVEPIASARGIVL